MTSIHRRPGLNPPTVNSTTSDSPDIKFQICAPPTDPVPCIALSGPNSVAPYCPAVTNAPDDIDRRWKEAPLTGRARHVLSEMDGEGRNLQGYFVILLGHRPLSRSWLLCDGFLQDAARPNFPGLPGGFGLDLTCFRGARSRAASASLVARIFLANSACALTPRREVHAVLSPVCC